MDAEKLRKLYEKAQLATTRKEAQKVLKKIKKLERKELEWFEKF